MPTLTTERPATVAAVPLFVGLHSYTEAQAAIFFGRNDEIDRLTNLIKANTLTIVFGKSGTGKTSLLNAGVFPRLRKEYCLPFRIRLEFANDSPDLVSQIKHTLKAEIDKYGFRVESYPGTETLWEYFHREQLWKSVTPILIFDQFEEIFTLAKKSDRFNKDELDAFWELLADLIENSIPEELKPRFLNEDVDYSYRVQKIKILFSFREEFLPEFESITAKIPSLKYSRFRLLPMNGHQAYEVVTKTWKAAINTAQAQKIVDFFSAVGEEHQPYELMTVEPSLLSQVCSLLEKERLREGRDKISAEFLDKYSKTFILRSIYEEALNESNRAVKAADGLPTAERPVNLFVEDKLITDEGYRTRYALSEGDKAIVPGLAVLKSKYFVRDEDQSIELTHDVLTPLIKADREERRKELALAAARKKARRRVMVITTVAALAALGFWYFTAGKAIEKKKEAEKEARVLGLRIDSSNAVLKTIDSTIKRKSEILKAVETGRPGAADSAWRLQYMEQIHRDSLQLSVLNQQNQQLTAQKLEWERRDSLSRALASGSTATQKQLFDSINRVAQAQKTEIASLNGQSEQLKKNNDDLRAQAEQLKKSNEDLQKRYDDLQKKYDDLQKARQSPPKEKTDLPPPETGTKVSSFDAADTNSLKLTMFYSNAKRAVETDLKIYLIPSTAANKSLIDKINDTPYDRRCDESGLNGAKGGKRALYVNGTYVFLDVPPGKYFIKVCTPFGNNTNVTKKGRGNETTRLNVAPPVTD